MPDPNAPSQSASASASASDIFEAQESTHAELRESVEFRAQITRLDKITAALVDLVKASWLVSSRYSPIIDELLLYTSTDDTLESVIVINGLVKTGVHNTTRRELRYLLESSVKHVYVDQKLPNVNTHSQSDRVSYLASNVPRSSIEVVKDVSILFGSPTALTAFHNEVKSTWSKMSGYVHPSVSQTSERLQRATRGAYIGFEDVKSLKRVVDDIAAVYDMLGVLWLTGAGPTPAGEILTSVETPDWPFARSKWLPAMSRFYDYKAERQSPRSNGSLR